jgi:hypothetical protein
VGEPRRHGSRLRFGVPACVAARDRVDQVLLDWDRERPDLDFTPVGTAVTSSVGLAGLLEDLAGRRAGGLTLLRGNDTVTVRLPLPQAR